MTFKDHFSDESQNYARFRPRYPEELFTWLAATSPACETVWDCATGSGQAAVPLSRYFARVVATDASAAQIANASQAANIDYRKALAEDSGIAPASVDLVTVAQALHWFEHQRFYEEVRRVCRPGALIAAWTYSAADVAGPMGEIIRRFHDETVGAWWPPERAHVSSSYRTLAFPFEEIETPAITVPFAVDRAQLVGYLGTWSATRAYRRDTGIDPLVALRREIEAVWPGRREILELEIPLAIRAGFV